MTNPHIYTNVNYLSNQPLIAISAPITMRVEASMADTLDPAGELRRAGSLNLKAVPITEQLDAWTPRTAKVSFRVDRLRGRLYRRDMHPALIGGYSIKYISLSNFRLMQEWLENYPEL